MLGPHPLAEIHRSQHHAHAEEVDRDRQKGRQQIGVCRFAEINLDAEANDNSEDGVEENKGPRGAGESARDVEGHGGNENISKAAEREDGVGSLELLDDAKQHREEEGEYERNAIGKWEAHSFSFTTKDWFDFQRPAVADAGW
jgi:hypothetical protein